MLISKTARQQTGFTIVELLIVIVVIAILAAISIVAYGGIQERARNAQRTQDVRTIAKALELYYINNGQYPSGACGSSCPVNKKINSSWATTSDGSWSVLEAALVPDYISALPTDPKASTSTPAAISGGYNYDYVVPGGWCSAAAGNIYLLTYNLEGATSVNQDRNVPTGTSCPGTQVTNYSSSEYSAVK